MEMSVLLLLLVAAFHALGAKAWFCDDVAIVGAGPAGTYSAYRLRKDDLSITLYEYSDRVGGRLYTMNLDGAKDVNVEMGGMRFVNSVHTRMGGLVSELGLTATEFVEGFGHAHRMRYYLRNTSLTKADLTSDKLPYQLTPEEKAHADALPQYFMHKLLGNQKPTLDNLLTLKTPDGKRFLYELGAPEAFRLAGASEEALIFMEKVLGFNSLFLEDYSYAAFLHDEVAFESADDPVMTVQEGLSAVPRRLQEKFLQASWLSHKFQKNHRLMGIEKGRRGIYELHFERTKSKDGVTIGTGQAVTRCAKKVILAVSNTALNRIFWKPLQEDPDVKDNLLASLPGYASKLALVYPHAFWETAVRNATVLKTDLLERMSYDFGDSETGNSVIIASYTDGADVESWRRLQSQGTPIPKSLPGDHEVTSAMVDRVKQDFARVFDLPESSIPDPLSGAVVFYDSFPPGCGWRVWRRGSHWDKVGQALLRPVPTEDVYIVTSDIAPGEFTSWTEGALTMVDKLMQSYFKQ